MKKIAAVALLALAMAVSFNLSGVLAQDEAAPQGVAVVVKGLSVGLLDTFAKDAKEGAGEAYANINALKVSEIDVNDLAALKGKIVTVLPNAAAAPMLTGKTAGKDCEITGKYFKDANVLLVEELTFEGSDDDWGELDTGKGSGMPVL